MTEQQQHLQSAIQQQNTLVQEIQSLQSQLDSKRQLALKAQGIIEYLDQIGVKLPEAETDAGTVAEGDDAPVDPAAAAGATDTQVVPS
tara:strand:+ start:602 stop:865 length:264 start_codon:yes stop_codon:yes gene_type:complete